MKDLRSSTQTIAASACDNNTVSKKNVDDVSIADFGETGIVFGSKIPKHHHLTRTSNYTVTSVNYTQKSN